MTFTIGQAVTWDKRDPRICQHQAILEHVNTRMKIAKVSYSVEGKSERFIAYKNVRELRLEV